VSRPIGNRSSSRLMWAVVAAMALGLTSAGCGSPASTDGGDALSTDAATIDAAPTDGVSPDAVGADANPGDVSVGVDTGDAATDVVALDSPGLDTSPPADVPLGDTGCTGTFTATVTAPAAGAMIETCTVSGMGVYYNFTVATAGSPAAMVRFNWRNPDGLLVGAPVPIASGPPFVARRQVGGNMITGMPPPLASAGGRNAIGGTWRVEAEATDTCGRTAMAMQSFTLILTMRSCPNP